MSEHARAAQKATCALPYDSGHSLTRKRRRLDREASSTAEVAAANVGFNSGLSEVLPLHCPSTLLSSAALGDAETTAAAAESCLPTPSPYTTFSVCPEPAPVVSESMPSGLELSLARLEAESHAVRLRQSKAVRDDSQTGGTYARHLTRYQVWWESDQASRSTAEPGYTPIPSLPVTAAKAVMFLEHETTREKVGLSPFSF